MTLSPSEIFQEIYNYIKELAKSGETSIKSLIISILVYVAKEFFKANIFICPIQHYRVYGNLFIYGPAVVLFCISLLASETFWHLTTGVVCCRRVRWWRSRKSVYLAILPPFVWLILVFADVEYYVCANIGPLKIAKASANTTAAKQALDLKVSNVRSESQIIAWGLLLLVVVAATIMLTIDRCISRPGSKIIKENEFMELEADIAVDIFNQKIKPLAQTKAKQVIDDLFDECKDKNPEEIVRIGEGYLAGKYPNFAGGPTACCSSPKEHRQPIKDILFKNRPKKIDDVEVKLTESGPQKEYTSIQ